MRRDGNNSNKFAFSIWAMTSVVELYVRLFGARWMMRCWDEFYRRQRWKYPTEYTGLLICTNDFVFYYFLFIIFTIIVPILCVQPIIFIIYYCLCLFLYFCNNVFCYEYWFYPSRKEANPKYEVSYYNELANPFHPFEVVSFRGASPPDRLIYPQ